VQRRHFLGLGAAGILGWVLRIRPWSPPSSLSDDPAHMTDMVSIDASGRTAPSRQVRPGPDSSAETGPSEPTSALDERAGEPSRDPSRSCESSESSSRPSQTDDVPPERNAPDEPPAEVASEEQSPVAVRLELICREALGLSPAGFASTTHTIHTLTLHHTELLLEENALAPERLRRHQRYHKQQGWDDIAYHYGVDLAGNIYELRDPMTAGDTFTRYDPTGHLLVVCEGDFNHQRPTEALLNSVAQLFAFAASTHGASLATLAGHRDHAVRTSCPGDNLQRELDSLRREAVRLLEAVSFESAMICGEEGRRRVAAITAGR
jgi:hypothetical protein